jgi:hypothetical protein
MLKYVSTPAPVKNFPPAKAAATQKPDIPAVPYRQYPLSKAVFVLSFSATFRISGKKSPRSVAGA